MLTVAARWGDVFRGRRIMHARDVLFDRDRLCVSMGAIGVDLVFVPAPDEVFAALQAEAANGRLIDVLILDGHGVGGAGWP